MLPKTHRIPRKLWKPLLESRVYFNSPHFLVRVANSETPRLAVSVSKKVSKSAVVRNTVRRRVYATVSTFLPTLTKNLFLIIAKPGSQLVKSEALRAELAGLLKKG